MDSLPSPCSTPAKAAAEMAAMRPLSPTSRPATRALTEPPPPEAEWMEGKFPIKVAQEAAGRGLVGVEGRGLGARHLEDGTKNTKGYRQAKAGGGDGKRKEDGAPRCANQ